MHVDYFILQSCYGSSNTAGHFITDNPLNFIFDVFPFEQRTLFFNAFDCCEGWGLHCLLKHVEHVRLIKCVCIPQMNDDKCMILSVVCRLTEVARNWQEIPHKEDRLGRPLLAPQWPHSTGCMELHDDSLGGSTRQHDLSDRSCRCLTKQTKQFARIAPQLCTRHKTSRAWMVTELL